MNRRDWLKKAMQLAALGVAGSQLELLEKIGWQRTIFPAAAVGSRFLHKSFALGFEITPEMLEDDYYLVKGDKYEEELSVWADVTKDKNDRDLIDMLKADMKDYKTIRPYYTE